MKRKVLGIEWWKWLIWVLVSVVSIIITELIILYVIPRNQYRLLKYNQLKQEGE